MHNSKELLIAALAVILLIGATPLFAQLEGPWAGNGEGSCETPTGVIIYPWQIWQGFVENGTFEGVWEDLDGNYGDFHGGIISFRIPAPPEEPHEIAYCEGEWTWVDERVIPPVVYTMGEFWMDFHLFYGTCNGEWWPYSGAPGGTMWGWRIGD